VFGLPRGGQPGAGLVEIILGVRAERKGLEDIAQPLTAQ
jgi:hypothetical protein